MNRITKRGQRRSYLRIGMTLAATAAIALIAGGQPSEAKAADGTTDVTVQVAEGDENLAWSVPTKIPMKATASGTLIGPDADAIAIKNLSSFPIRVKQMGTTAEAPFNLVDDVDKSSGNNDFQMSMNGVAAKQTVELPDDGTWAMGYMGNEKGSDKLPLTISAAKIARVTEDLSAAKKAAAFTWTAAPTTTIKPEPKPDPDNGTVFAIDSNDAGTTKFYKRDRVPEAGEVFEGETVEADNIYTGSTMHWLTQVVWVYEATQTFPTNTRTIEAVDYGIKLSDIPRFYGCRNIDAINLTKLDISQVTSLGGLFGDIDSLSFIDVSTWNTSKVTNMSYCFHNSCKSQHYFTIDLSGWDTSNVTSMHAMFSGTPGLSVTGFDKWNTSNVTDMSEMFSSSSAADRGIEGWDVSNVKSMSKMFGYSGYTEWDINESADVPIYTSNDFRYLDLSKWDVSNVTDFSYMFDHTAAGGLDLSKWNVSKGRSFCNMFAYCFDNSSTLNISNWNLSLINISTDCSSLNRMFAYSNIGSVDASNWTFTGYGDISYLFYNSGIYDIDLSSWNVSGICYFNHMFEGCHNLTTVGNLSNWDIGEAQSMVATFKDCPNLTLDCSSWKTDNRWFYLNGSLEDFNAGSPGVIPVPNPYA